MAAVCKLDKSDLFLHMCKKEENNNKITIQVSKPRVDARTKHVSLTCVIFSETRKKNKGDKRQLNNRGRTCK